MIPVLLSRWMERKMQASGSLGSLLPFGTTLENTVRERNGWAVENVIRSILPVEMEPVDRVESQDRALDAPEEAS